MALKKQTKKKPVTIYLIIDEKEVGIFIHAHIGTQTYMYAHA